VQDRRRVLQLSGLAYDGRLAIALGLCRLDSERLHAALAEHPAQFLADVHQLGEVLRVAAGKRVGDHRHRHGTPRRRTHLTAHLHADFVHLHHDLPDVRFHVVLPRNANRKGAKAQSVRKGTLVAFAFPLRLCAFAVITISAGRRGP
jgi:hypothetical protein